jgi:hypothetical protein
MTDGSPSGEAPTESPAAAIDRLAGELDGVRRRVVGQAVEFERAGTVFATRESAGFSFRLRADIVAAALRTPGTARSGRGADWVELTPVAADSFDFDRATAWFETAWRFAAEPADPGAPAN